MSNQPGTVPTVLAATGGGQQVAQQATQQGDGKTGATTTLEGMVTITIAQHKFTLSGTLAKSAVIVEYHADFADSVTLGTITDIASELAQVFGIDDLKTDIDNALSQIQNLPVAFKLANQLLGASVRITDLVINTATSTYGIGMALDFSADPPTLLNTIELDSIGFKVTRSKPAPASTTPA
jgi:hypothetical protein